MTSVTSELLKVTLIQLLWAIFHQKWRCRSIILQVIYTVLSRGYKSKTTIIKSDRPRTQWRQNRLTVYEY